MSPASYAGILLSIAGLIFSAGAFYAGVSFGRKRDEELRSELRKDVNGLGLKVRNIEAAGSEYHMQILIAFLELSPNEKHAMLLEVLRKRH